MLLKRPLLVLSWLVAQLATVQTSHAQPASSELLRLVGADAVVCVEATDLRSHWPRLRTSPFARRLEQTWFYREWRESDNFDRLQQARRVVEQQIGQPIGEFAADLFGQSVVIALYAPPDGGDPVGVVLTEASTNDALRHALEVWNREPKITSVRVQHADTEYFRRTKPAKGDRKEETLYYVVLENTLAISDHEALIRRVIDLDASAGRDSLFTSERYQQAQRSLRPETVASFYFNPRVLDAEVDRKADGAPEAQFLADVWHRIEAVAAGLSWDGGISGECVFRLAADEAPAAWRRSVERLSGRPTFLERVPQRALAVYAGRHDLASLARLIMRLTPEQKREKWTTFRQVSRGLLLGRDLFDDVLPQLGVNWGAYIVPRERLEPKALPVDVLAAVELPPLDPAQETGRPNLRAALENGLNTGLNLLAAFHNSQAEDRAAVVRSKSIAAGPTGQETVIRWIDGLGPHQPAYALAEDAIVFASRPDLLEEYVRGDSPGRLVDRLEFKRWRARSFAEAHQVAFVHLAEVREFLARNRRFFIAEAVGNEGLSDADAEARLNRLNDVLQLFDGAYFAVEFEQTQVRLTAGGIVEPNSRDKGNAAP